MATSAESYDFGRYLQELRRAQEIPLEAVSQVTKIRLVVLQQIENEDLKALPTPTITRGFIRAFADAVGADRDEALKRYDVALGAQTLKTQQQTAVQPKPRSVWPSLLFAILLIALLIGLSLYLVNLPERSKPAAPAPMPEPRETPQAPHAAAPMPAPQQTPQASTREADQPAPVPDAQNAAEETETTAPADATAPRAEDIETPAGIEKEGDAAAPEETEDAATAVAPEVMATPVPGEVPESTGGAPAMEAAPPEPPGERLVLEVIAVELTWMKITADDTEPREWMVRPGRHLILDARQRFKLDIGNAAGVQLKLNGQAVGVPGGSGKVVHLQLP